MNYAEWEKRVPEAIREDVLWKMKVYRLSLFLSEISWEDVSKLAKDTRTKSLSNQLYRARFYEYSLGSARESRGWFYRGRHVLGEKVFEHRTRLLTEIIKLLLTIVPEERGYRIEEEMPEYTLAAPLYMNVPF